MGALRDISKGRPEWIKLRGPKRKKFSTLSPEINGNQLKLPEKSMEINREVIKFNQKSEAYRRHSTDF